MTEFEKSDEQQLKTISWIPFVVENNTYILKYIFHEKSYTLMLSNFIHLYSEELCDAEIQQRCEELNPGIEVPLERILKQLQNCIEEFFKSKDDCRISSLSVVTVDAKHLKLNSKSFLAEIPFFWHFYLDAKEASYMFSYLVKPLVGVTSELQRRNKELIKIIKKKDDEIEDYKAGGSKVSRKYLETQVFNENEFQTNMDKSEHMLDCLEKSVKIVFEQDLFFTVSSAQEHLLERGRYQMESSSEASIPKESKEKVLDKAASNVAPEEPAVKNKKEELQRRMFLQKQLEMKIKKKGKKKVIKL